MDPVHVSLDLSPHGPGRYVVHLNKWLGQNEFGEDKGYKIVTSRVLTVEGPPLWGYQQTSIPGTKDSILVMNEDVAILQNFASDADLQALSQESVHELLAGDVHDDVLSTGDLDEEWEGVSTSAVAEPDFKPGVPYMDPCTPPTFHSIVVSWRRPSGMPRGSVKSYTIQYSKDSGMSSPVSTTSESLGQEATVQFHVSGLDPGTPYFFRVAARSTSMSDPGPFSDIGSITTSGVKDGKCNNPLFPAPGMKFPSAPGPRLDKDMCAPVSKGNSTAPQSCCSAHSQHHLNHEMNRQRLVLAKGVAGFSEMVEAMLRVSEQVTMEAASGARVNAIHSAFEDGMTSVKTFVSNQKEAIEKCFPALLEYLAGMYCLGCHPHWQSFVSPQGASKLDPSVCTRVSDACHRLVHTYHQAVIGVENIYQAGFPNGIPSTFRKPILVPTQSPCASGNDCKDHICSTVLSGSTVKLGALKRSTPSNHQVFMQEAADTNPFADPLLFVGTSSLSDAGSTAASKDTSNVFQSGGYDAIQAGRSSSFALSMDSNDKNSAAPLTLPLGTPLLLTLLLLLLSLTLL